jgi:peptidyl-prolyl cis-trans isomerase B (cyclophilin B)
VARTKDRQRALARAKLERQIARRAAMARRRRQIQAGTAAGLALVVVVVAVLWISGVFDSDKADDPVVAGDCAWTAHTVGEPKDAGMPATTGIAKTGTQTMSITTDQGVVEATIDTAAAPCTAASFTHLAGRQFFDNTKCHRLTTSGIFVLQCGDPSGNGAGGPTYRFLDENLPEPVPPSADPSASASTDPSASPEVPKALYKAGTLAMANSGPNTNGSQFFIVYQDSMMEPKYTVFGTVTKGLDVVQKVAQTGVAEGGTTATDGKPKTEVTIQTLTVTAADAAPDPNGSTGPPPSDSAPAGQSPSASNPQS